MVTRKIYSPSLKLIVSSNLALHDNLVDANGYTDIWLSERKAMVIATGKTSLVKCDLAEDEISKDVRSTRVRLILLGISDGVTEEIFIERWKLWRDGT